MGSVGAGTLPSVECGKSTEGPNSLRSLTEWCDGQRKKGLDRPQALTPTSPALHVGRGDVLVGTGTPQPCLLVTWFLARECDKSQPGTHGE